jgi:hypothetical protein
MLPRQKIKRAVISTSIAALFLILTALIAFQALGAVTGILHAFCFAFHVIPFGIAYGGDSEVYILLYYILLWAFMSWSLYFMLNLILKRPEN